ncbi:hypothetical protein LTR37_009526 [Vermiconidia calcicola]|uniref:Uncharacterized protein n=1 Tax=Vermiconidia calcicola TaxID=1690605 RepID=A0ACC3N7Y7_9PEZI|nr:hypothetical protein LTR37_009526 [Vermiconidia calcicola]
MSISKLVDRLKAPLNRSHTDAKTGSAGTFEGIAIELSTQPKRLWYAPWKREKNYLQKLLEDPRKPGNSEKILHAYGDAA